MNIFHWTYLVIVGLFTSIGYYYVNPTPERLVSSLIMFGLFDICILIMYKTHKPTRKKKKRKYKNEAFAVVAGMTAEDFANSLYVPKDPPEVGMSPIVDKEILNYILEACKPPTLPEQKVFNSVDDMLDGIY